MTSRQIEKDLLRTLPGHVCFNSKQATGVPRLRRILRGLAWLYPDIGYCQGMGMIAATFLLIMEEEDAFWMMVAIIEDFLPPSYYSPSLIGVQADQVVLRGLIPSHLPALDTLLQVIDILLRVGSNEPCKWGILWQYSVETGQSTNQRGPLQASSTK